MATNQTKTKTRRKAVPVQANVRSIYRTGDGLHIFDGRAQRLVRVTETDISGGKLMLTAESLEGTMLKFPATAITKRVRVYADTDVVGGMSFAEFKEICHTIGIETMKEVLRLVKAGGYSPEQIVQRAVAKTSNAAK